MATLLMDFISIHQDIVKTMNNMNKPLKFIYKHTLYKHYHKKLRKSFNTIIKNKTILERENIDEMITCLYSSFPSSNGAYGNVMSCQEYRLNDDAYINECVVDLEDGSSSYNSSSVTIKICHGTGDPIDDENIVAEFHIVNGSVTFTNTFKGKMLIGDKQHDKVDELNVLLLETMRDYLEYIYDREEDNDQ